MQLLRGFLIVTYPDPLHGTRFLSALALPFYAHIDLYSVFMLYTCTEREQNNACQRRVSAGAISGRRQYSLVNTVPHHKIITFDIFEEFTIGDIIH